MRSQVSTDPTSRKARFWGALILIAVAAGLRLLPHPANFSPISAMALFGGAVLVRRSWAIALPLAAMFVSDLVLGLHTTLPLVYFAIALTSVLGFWIAKRRSVLAVGGASVLSAVLFFVLTNFAVWMSGELYPRTMAGLVDCYVMAVPFFQNTLISNLFFTAAFFGAWALAERTVPQLQLRYQHEHQRHVRNELEEA